MQSTQPPRRITDSRVRRTRTRMTHETRQTKIPRTSDVRRLRRSRAGIAAYTIRHLAEALKRQRRYVAGATIVLVGFEEHEDGRACENASEIISSLERNGARIRHVSTSLPTFDLYRAALEHALRGADAVLLDTDNRYFRALRPKEIRALGAPVVIPTSLRA